MWHHKGLLLTTFWNTVAEKSEVKHRWPFDVWLVYRQSLFSNGKGKSLVYASKPQLLLIQKVSQHVTIFCMFSFLFLNPGCQRPPWKKKNKQTGCTAQDEEMKWSNSGFTRLLPCKYLCRKESPVPTPISPARVLHLLPDQLMVRTQHFLWACRLWFPHQGAEPVRNFHACVMIIYFFAVSPVNERKEMSRTAPLVERVPFSDDAWLPIIQPDFDRRKGGGGGLMSNAERCNLQQTFVQLRVTHTERSSSQTSEVCSTLAAS